MTENQKPHIMVVDDTLENLKVINSILSAENYEVRPLSQGEQALYAAQEEVPDLILLDIMMPGLDGYQVCERLKANPVTAKVPVIFLSALQDAENKVRAFQLGGVDYISKPFQAEEVLARVATHLHLSQLQQALQQQNRQLQEAATLFEVSSDCIVLTDVRGVIHRVNPSFTELTGYAPEEVIGQTPRLFKSGRHDREFYQQLWHGLLQQGFWEGEIWNRHKNGSIYPQWERITAVRDAQGEVSGYIAQASEITRRKLTEREIRHHGNYDALTGLANRTLLLERLDQALKQHNRNRCTLCLLLIALDRFKQVNESLGYLSGDALLQQVAARLSDSIREIDTAARIGGSEFALVLTEQADHRQCEAMAKQVLERIQEVFVLPEGRAEIDASIGISLFPDDADSHPLLLRNATLALSRAKAEGGSRLRFFTEAMDKEVLQRHRLERDLRQALTQDQLSIHYQPIVDLHSGATLGVESLLRWRHPELGPISPAHFIPIAEGAGLIQAIGTWVCKAVCQQLQEWRQRGLVFYASVNVSAHQIPQGIDPKWLFELTQYHRLEPEFLVLEITETALADDLEGVTTWLEQVRELGFKVYLDDFGTGYSSLSYLKNFPVDAVKIDRAFIRDMVEQSRDRALVQAILAMSQSLDLQVVAEGIETQAQQQLLREINCNYGQGFVFSKPLPAEELVQGTGIELLRSE
ncbi:EAL domain-containing protein [Magnetovirga frankeli]|uniref:EAL domain-containing response regulator n=1 Tax=Magnetovirga frankeli TaxID=947516 RepID=UPI0012939214|nr:EAL domain-containing protein [gamma proteobacterium SS-5]